MFLILTSSVRPICLTYGGSSEKMESLTEVQIALVSSSDA